MALGSVLTWRYRGPDLFSPRDLATPLTALLADGIPDAPVLLGL
jgi:8-oxo-dGTP diphosphatase